jgi:hippurate hydrolase
VTTAAADFVVPLDVQSYFSLDDARRLVELRRELHRHPELSWQESETATRLVAALASFGITDVARVAGTGLVARVP